MENVKDFENEQITIKKNFCCVRSGGCILVSSFSELAVRSYLLTCYPRISFKIINDPSCSHCTSKIQSFHEL